MFMVRFAAAAAAVRCQVSCGQIKQLVRAVRPDVVMVELCKERLSLLVDPENPDRRAETWHCRWGGGLPVRAAACCVSEEQWATAAAAAAAWCAAMK
jgi:pheromone shutdown protein TraB